MHGKTKSYFQAFLTAIVLLWYGTVPKAAWPQDIKLYRERLIDAAADMLRRAPSNERPGVGGLLDLFPKHDNSLAALDISGKSSNEVVKTFAPKFYNAAVNMNTVQDAAAIADEVAKVTLTEAIVGVDRSVILKRAPLIRVAMEMHEQIPRKIRERNLDLDERMLGMAKALGLADINEALHEQVPSVVSEKIKLKMADGQIISLSPNQFLDQFEVVYTPGLILGNFLGLDFFRNNTLAYNRLSPDNRAIRDTFRERIASGHQADVYIAKIDPNIGHGLFANAPLSPGDLVGEYAGVVLNLFESWADPKYSFDYPSSEHYVIDSSDIGNPFRFINSSPKKNANAQVVPVFINGMWRLAVVAIEPIAKDAQILIDYGKKWFSSRNIPQVELKP